MSLLRLRVVGALGVSKRDPSSDSFAKLDKWCAGEAHGESGGAQANQNGVSIT